MAVVIIGGNRGIGAAIVRKIASKKENIIFTYHQHEEEAKKLQEEIEKTYGVQVCLRKVDITKENEVEDFFLEMKQTYIDINTVICNAGIALDTTFSDKTKQNFLKVLETNLVGHFLICKHFGLWLKEKKEGQILLISSTNGIDTTYPESLDYDASKAGLISLMHNLATFLAPFVRVNTIAPGWVNTEMNASLEQTFVEKETAKILLDRFAEPEEIANAAYFLISEEAHYINDVVLRVDGGIRK